MNIYQELKKFSHIKYCLYCHYAISHGHGADCLLLRMNVATGNADNSGEGQ